MLTVTPGVVPWQVFVGTQSISLLSVFRETGIRVVVSALSAVNVVCLHKVSLSIRMNVCEKTANPRGQISVPQVNMGTRTASG